MSARAMRRTFLPVLRALDGQLELPIPRRVRILRELESDLEALAERLVAQGVPGEAARLRALEVLVPDRATREELRRLHETPYRRLTRRMDEARLRVLERSALAAATLFVLAATTLGLVGADLLGDPSPYLWPVLGLGALLFAVVAAKVFQIWIKGDHRQPDRGVSSILVLSGGILGVGVGGTVFDLYRLAAILERAPELSPTLATVWLIRDCALLSVAIGFALAGGLSWLMLNQWLALVSDARRDVLGVGDFSRP